MAITQPRLFTPTVLGTSSAVIFTLAAGGSDQVTVGLQIKFVNTTAGAVDVSLWGDAIANASADGNAFLKAFTIPAKGYLDFDVPKLRSGDSLRGSAAAAASITVSHLGGYLTTL